MKMVSGLRLPAYRAASTVYGRFRLGGHPRRGLRILMYHAIGTPVEGDIRGLYNMSGSRFRSQMSYLAEHFPDRCVPFDGRPRDGDLLRISVTFDDGYRDNLTVAAPVLAKLGIPFTVFICTDAIAGRKTGFLGPDEVRELANFPGASIGAHSMSHARLTTCDDHRLNNELRGSKAYLEDLLGREVRTLAYPHGAVDRRVRNAAAHVGYQMGASSRFDINRPSRDPLLLCRTDIWADDDELVFGQKLRGDWDWLRWRHEDPSKQ